MFALFKDTRFLLLLALINFIAGVYSFGYYAWQFESAPWWLWVFIADCPIYALVFGISVLFLAQKKQLPLLAFISLVGSIKYALWTIGVLLLAGQGALFWYVIASHVLLLAEVVVLFRVVPFTKKHFLIGSVWFLVNDVLDYGFGLHPYTPEGTLAFAAGYAVVLSVVLSVGVFRVFSKKIPSK